MQIDAFTVLLFGVFTKALLGTLFLLFWFREPRALWFAWWSACYLLGAVAACLFMLRGVADDMVSIGIGNSMLVAAFAACWQGGRVFHRRPPLWVAMFSVPAVWFGACLVPDFVSTVEYRVVLSSVLVTPMVAMVAVEFWRGRDEALPSRWAVIALFASLALFFGLRIPLVYSLPFPFGALPVQPGWLGAFNLVLFFHSLILTVLIVALSKERLELDQRTKAQTDPLTGALNRRAFVSRGSRLLLRHEIEKKPLCLLFLDIDHFKSLNDRFGHSGGDDVLMTFVKVVHDNIRPTDFLFRMGGEEFCCLLPDTRTEQAYRVAERIRHQFEAATVSIAGTPVRATVSLGIASSDTFGYDADVLMRRADAAVYVAKRQGRNRVAVALPETAAGPSRDRPGEVVDLAAAGAKYRAS